MSATAAGMPRMRAAGRPMDRFDPWLVGAIGVVMLLGVLMVYSASVTLAERQTGNSMYYLWRQLAYLSLGVALMWTVARTRVSLWERIGPMMLIAGMVSLVLVLIPGIGAEINGSRRWIRLIGFNIQPSEFVKVFMVVYVAGYLVRKQALLRSFTRGILMVGIVLAILGVLLLQEPDMGTLVVLVATALTMLFLGGVRFWHFLACIGAGAGAITLLTVISPYRLERVTGFLNPWADPFNSGFQLVQALIAFGRGEWFGVGLGASVQKLFYLPAAHTDFILAVIAEELGLLGVVLVIALFTLIVARAFKVAREAEAVGLVYGARLAQGVGLLIAFQALINIGVNLGVLPTKGLTLPLMSYGGSSMVATCLALGLLLAVDRETRRKRWKRNG